MNKIYALGLMILLVYCGFLTYQIDKLKGLQVNETKDITVINNEINGFSTDLTKVIDESIDKVVSIKFSGTILNNHRTGVVVKTDAESAYIVVSYDEGYSDEIKVTFNNGVEYDGTILVKDPYTSLAIVSVDVDFKVNSVEFTSLESASIGEWVISVEASDDRKLTTLASVGIISSDEQSLLYDYDGDELFDFEIKILNSDINNSVAGPIFNLNGDMLGFKLPFKKTIISSEEINLMLKMLETNADVIRKNAGISIINVKDMPTYKKSSNGIKLDLFNGVVIDEITTKSMFSELEVNDVITKVNDIIITDWYSFYQVVNGLNEGEEISVTYYRQMEQLVSTIVIL